VRIVTGYRMDPSGRLVTEWSDNTPAEAKWGLPIRGSRIIEQPGRSPEETRLRAEKAAARRQTT
jgi:hypothetical protein